MTVNFIFEVYDIECPNCGKKHAAGYTPGEYSVKETIKLPETLLTCRKCKQYFTVEILLKPILIVNSLEKTKS
jgi:transcription elongation factor Elf1